MRLDANGTFRLESQEYPLRYLQADSDGFVRLRWVNNSAAQRWRAGNGTFGNRLTLANQDTGLLLNSMGLHDNAWFGVWTPNALGNQAWLFLPE